MNPNDLSALAGLLNSQQQGQQTQGDIPPEGLTGGRKIRQTKLQKACLMLYGTLGTLVMFVSPFDGAVILGPQVGLDGTLGKSHAEMRAMELAALAEENEWLKELIFQLVEKSALVSFIAGHAALAGALMAAHGTSPGKVWSQLWAPVQNRTRRQERQGKTAPAEVLETFDDVSQSEPAVFPESAAQNGVNYNDVYNQLESIRR